MNGNARPAVLRGGYLFGLWPHAKPRDEQWQSIWRVADQPCGRFAPTQSMPIRAVWRSRSAICAAPCWM